MTYEVHWREEICKFYKDSDRLNKLNNLYLLKNQQRCISWILIKIISDLDQHLQAVLWISTTKLTSEIEKKKLCETDTLVSLNYNNFKHLIFM